MKATRFAAILVAVLLGWNTALAVTIPTVPIGNPGNTTDVRYIDIRHPNGVGGVTNPFRIGTTEVTNAQYVEFLNAVAGTDTFGLYNDDLGDFTFGGIIRAGTPGNYTYSVKQDAIGQAPGGSNYSYFDKPAVYVSWFDALCFTNWLHNGQPSGGEDAGTTEDGAYTFTGLATVGTRNPDARSWLPSESEWYKAAFYDPAIGTYYDYPTRTNTPPNNQLPTTDTGNSANFNSNPGCATGNCAFPLTVAGAYSQSYSAYGTFDQAANVWEWSETSFTDSFGSWRFIRGGSW